MDHEEGEGLRMKANLGAAQSSVLHGRPKSGRPISADQVAWMLAAIGRYLPQDGHPSTSRAREMAQYGLLYEIMESAYLCFEDEAARFNGTPADARMPAGYFNLPQETD